MSTTPITEFFDYIFNWHSHSDACPKCKALSGKEWREQDLFQNTLWDPIWGDVWDLNANQTLVHPNCRCQLAVRVQVKPISQKELLLLKQNLQDLHTELQNLITSLRGQ